MLMEEANKCHKCQWPRFVAPAETETVFQTSSDSDEPKQIAHVSKVCFIACGDVAETLLSAYTVH
jgi:hypothetical protein